jgi:hypothetical protein
MSWPGTSVLSTLGNPGELAGERCGVITGEELTRLMPLARRANQLTPWRSDGEAWALVLRPLLPDESGC